MSNIRCSIYCGAKLGRILMNIKAVVTDLNGTLLLPSGTMGSFTKQVINQLIREGKKFFIATGRSKNEIKELITSFHLHETNYITLNGGRVYDYNWQELISYDLAPLIAEDILSGKKSRYKDFIHCIYKIENQEDKLYVDMHDLHKINAEDNLIDKSNRKFENIEIFADYNNIAAIIIGNREDKLLEYENSLLQKHKCNINTFLSNPTTLEIVDIGASKGKALKAATNQYKIELNEIIAFGNGFNDLDMLSTSGKGVMTENANERLKKALPNIEIIAPSWNESVAHYINNNILLNPIKISES